MKKFQYNSPVVISFFLISFAALVLGWLSNNWTTASLFSVYRSSFRDPFTYIRLISHVLGHADLEHFFGNMLMFLVIGPPLEERYGSRVLLTGILLTALVSGLLQIVLFPNSALLGASGIVFMLIMLSSLSGMEDGGMEEPAPRRAAPSGGSRGGAGQQRRAPVRQQPDMDEDLGPAFPSEASNMDDIPF